jgi:large subunit ribosomal protein L9
MRVIFTQEVAGVGKRDEVREVSDGYALNFLLPRGLAINATPQAEAAVVQRQARRVQSESRAAEQAQGYLSQLQGRVVVVKAKASPSGTLYAALTHEQVTDAVQAASKIPLLPNQIVAEHLKTIGDHKVAVKLHKSVTANLTLRIQPA